MKEDKTMNIGRNDPCPCGSGKKYKNCCMNKNDIFSQIREVVKEQGYKDELADVLCRMLRYMQRKNWIGACHSTCSVIYVALRELGYEPEICIGEVKAPAPYGLFDHSWITLDGKIIDMAIDMTLLGDRLSASKPIVLDRNVETKGRPFMIYGVRDGMGLNAEATRVLNTPFNAYMDSFRDEIDGLWGVLKYVLDKDINIDELKGKYVATERNYVKTEANDFTQHVEELKDKGLLSH